MNNSLQLAQFADTSGGHFLKQNVATFLAKAVAISSSVLVRMMTASRSSGKHWLEALKPEVEPPCPMFLWPSKASTFQPKPYFRVLPSLSFTGVHICSLMAALSRRSVSRAVSHFARSPTVEAMAPAEKTSVRSESRLIDRKSTRLNSSHLG